MACSSHESGMPDRRHRQRQLGSRLLLGALNPDLDLANVLEVLVEAHPVAAAKPALERGDVAGHRVEDAAVLLHPLDPLFHRARAPEQALEHGTRVGLERDRLRRRLPRDRVHVGAAVAGIAGADVAREVLGGDLDRGEHGILTDLVGDDLVERRAVPKVLGFRALRGAARQPGPGADGVRALQRPVEVRDHVDVVAELFDRLEDRAELEAGALGRRRPVARALAHRHEHRAEAACGRGGGPCGRRERRDHGVEQRQGQRGAHGFQNRSTRQRRLGDEHGASLREPASAIPDARTRMLAAMARSPGRQPRT